MRKSYEWEIDAGMIFKKHYCRVCGTRLKKIKFTNYRFEESDFDVSFRGLCLNIKYHPETKVQENHYKFICSTCHKIISYEDQRVINEIKKITKMKLIDDEILSNIEIVERANKRIKIKDMIYKTVESLVIVIFIGVIIYFNFLNDKGVI